jgi:hypothetical protein
MEQEKFKGIIHSGGATGADQAFGDYGTRFGYKVIHHSFAGYQVNGKGEVAIHSQADIPTISASLGKAAQVLNRLYPPKTSYDHMLLVRDYFQVINSEFLIAVASLENETMLTEGTAWTVQVAISKGKTVYVYDDYQTYEWYVSQKGNKFIHYSGTIPNIGEFAGIGSRKISERGLNTIIELLRT